MRREYAIIVKSKTRLESLIERFNTKAQARFYIERSGGNFADYEAEHEAIQTSLSYIQRHLTNVVKHKTIERSFVPSFLFNDNQLVVVVGQDGLVANTAKYVSGLPIVAVNPDTNRYDGVLLPYTPDNCIGVIESVVTEKYKYREVSLAEARLNDGQSLLAFNDFFIGVSSHVSARYKITYNRKSEQHSSSGIIVSTKAGSTGWLSSIFNMAYGVHEFAENENEKTKRPVPKDDQLIFAVREPFASQTTQTDLVAGTLSAQSQLLIESHMPVNGVIFSDGVEKDFLQFNSGAIATIGLAKQKAMLVIQ